MDLEEVRNRLNHALEHCDFNHAQRTGPISGTAGLFLYLESINVAADSRLVSLLAYTIRWRARDDVLESHLPQACQALPSSPRDWRRNSLYRTDDDSGETWLVLVHPTEGSFNARLPLILACYRLWREDHAHPEQRSAS